MLGFVFYVAYGAIPLKHFVDPGPTIGMGYCINIGRVQGVLLLPIIWAHVLQNL